MDSSILNKLVASTCTTQLPVARVEQPAIWVILASLAKGGAERIVLDWLINAQSQGYRVRLIVQHTLQTEWPVPPTIPLVRASGNSEQFMRIAAENILKESGKVFTHLVRDNFLEILWQAGLSVIPTVHNASAGWRNDPTLWNSQNVPFVIAVSDIIGDELKAKGCVVPVVVIRHQPGIPDIVFSKEQRAKIREHYRIEPDEIFIGMIGSLKRQKNYTRALRVLAKFLEFRKAKLFIAGGHGESEMVNIHCEGAQLKLIGKVFMPGFIDANTVMPAFDVVLNTSDFEGFSIATQEALFSGLPVIASNVGGQSEIKHKMLTLVEADDEQAYVEHLKQITVRETLVDGRPKRSFSTSRLWTLAAIAPTTTSTSDKVLFVTANLNAGGAQRSLVNLSKELLGQLDFEVAVTGTSTHSYFGDVLTKAGINAFRPTESRNVIDIATALLAYMAENPVKTLVFWNADPKLKLLLTKFLPAHRLIDVSPGHYAFLEMQETASFQMDLAFTEQQCYRALTAFVLKFTSSEVPAELASKLYNIPNGVVVSPDLPTSGIKKLVVQGRIAASKQLDVILAAMPLVRQSVACELHIYGQAEERSIDLLATLLTQAHPMKEYVHFHGASPDLVERLGGFDGAVVLGMHQGCPNAVLEALAAGVPVVANDSGGTRELILHEETGLLLPEETTPEVLAAAIVRLLNMDKNSMQGKAKAHAKNFTMKKMASSYLPIFKGN